MSSDAGTSESQLVTAMSTLELRAENRRECTRISSFQGGGLELVATPKSARRIGYLNHILSSSLEVIRLILLPMRYDSD